MIVGKDVCKSFEGFKALDNASFHVRKGSVYGLVAPNGAGKSTLIRHITGVFEPDSGSINVAGENVFENSVIKEKIAYIPDDIFYFKQASLDDMMKYYAGIYKNFDRDLYEKLCGGFPALNRKMRVRRMSKGMQKQSAFLLAVSMRPEILVLDEPVDGLDPVMRKQIWNILLNEVTKYGVTVLVSSHNLRELEDVCDYVGIMNRGKVIIERSLAELQGSVSKIQIAFANEVPDFEKYVNVVNHSVMGKVHTLIVKGDSETVEDKLMGLNPILMDLLPLTLEEIFIYELGGENYEVKDILF